MELSVSLLLKINVHPFVDGYVDKQLVVLKLEALERLYRSTGLIFLQWQKKFLTIIIQSLHFSSLKKKGMEKTCEKRRKKLVRKEEKNGNHHFLSFPQ